MITRRCTQRQFLMRPDRGNEQRLHLLPGRGAARYRIEVIFTVAMSNHHHTGSTTPKGTIRRSSSTSTSSSPSARTPCAAAGRTSGPPNRPAWCRLVEPDDVINKMVYALTNPVKDGLVEKAHHWPGVTSLEAHLHGSTLSATRPKHFFREKGPMPESVELRFAKPRGLEHFSDEELAKLILERVRGARGERRGRTSPRWDEGPGPQGRARAAVERPARKPRATARPRPARRRTQPVEPPRSAPAKPSFRDAYAAAQRNHRRSYDVLFPAGTYWLPRFADAPCEPHLSSA